MGISPRVAFIASWRKIWLPERGISAKQLFLNLHSNYPCLYEMFRMRRIVQNGRIPTISIG
ncbi:Uncharacterized protein APZ42_031459 [Daphnia magna]|uniref:Uncharacterized protein n=1 Tax=Daphnia magna TaxID=35525 RepID=A0A164MUF1_9CRUS|nr:Uncharacterized protein APZ42_031459 [Daphnia magna]